MTLLRHFEFCYIYYMPLPLDEKIYYLAFSRLGFIGPVKFTQLLKYFGSAKKAFLAPVSEYPVFAWNENQLTRFTELKRSFSPEKELQVMEKKEIKMVTAGEDGYPKNLQEISDAPYILYIRGEIKPEDKLALAIVGSRRMSSYGFQVIETIVPELVLSGLTLVSGLAFGVDYAVAKVALDNGGRSIAVLASGVDIVTPRSNEDLARRLLDSGQGAVVSELPPGTQPLPHYFPVRNRIISGLSLGTLVVEAAAKSGSLYTAEAAVEQGREVFAVPGSIFNPLTAGTAGLLKEGAKMVLTAADILEELNVETSKSQITAENELPKDEKEAALLSVIGHDEIHVDLLAKEAGWKISDINSTLMSLELKGLVKNLGGGVYRAARKNF